MPAVLAQAGIAATSARVRGEIQRLTDAIEEWPQTACVARESGYHAGAVVLPGTLVVGRPLVERFLVKFRSDVPVLALARRGSFRAWRRLVWRYARQQPNLVFVLALAFAGMLADLIADYGNPFFEFVGVTSTGKTTLMDLFSSVWGAPRGPGGIGTTWRTTVAAMEQTMAARQYACLPIDEVSAAAFGSRDAARIVGDVAFLIGQGADRARFNGPLVRLLRVAALSTSNVSVAQQLRDSGLEDTTDPVEARLITIPIDPGSGLGMWSRVPRRCSGPGAAAESLAAALRDEHGTAAVVFARRLARARRRDEQGLRELLATHIATFMDRAEVSATDGIARRRAAKFAWVYAAGRLACDWDVLPFRSVGPDILAVYRRAEALRVGAADATRTPFERIQAYVRQHDSAITDLDEGYAELSVRAMNQAPGFLKTVHGRRCLLLRRRALIGLFGAEYTTALRSLRAAKRLVGKEGNQLQTRVRAGRTHNRVYAVSLD